MRIKDNGIDSNIDILLKQTTSKNVKCRACKSNVDGEDGYIKINMITYSWNNRDKKIVLCHKCFNEFISGIEMAKKNKEKSYNKLVKTKILENLEKNG